VISKVVDHAFLSATATGAKPTLYAALSEEAGLKENWGSYWDEHCVKRDIPNEAKANETLIADLWKQSCKDAGLSEAI
jgi:hypothetical protein